MASSTKNRSVAALLLLVAVVVGTSVPGAHAGKPAPAPAPVVTSITNLCPANVTVFLYLNFTLPLLGINPVPGGNISLLNVTVAANGGVTLLPFALNLQAGVAGIAISFTGNPGVGLVTVPVGALDSGLLSSVTSIVGAIVGPTIGGLLGTIVSLLAPEVLTNITINCADTSCNAAGLALANASVTVMGPLGATAKVCI